MTEATCKTEDLEASIADTFDLLAWEIELAGARCIFLDTVIGNMLMTVPEDKRVMLVEGMQTVDLLAQHLTGLSAFARRLGQTVPPDIATSVQDALSEITLGALAQRMTVALSGVDNDTDQHDEAGDLDLF